MSKISPLTTIVSGYLSTTQLNANFAAIVAAFSNTVSRDGSTPNSMSANLDLNSNRIINVTNGINPQDVATINQLTNAAALVTSAAFLGTSVTSNTIGTGAKTFATQTNLAVTTGTFVVISRTSSPTNYFFGQVSSYSAGSLVVGVTSTSGSGTFTDWSISLSGPQGAAGGGTGTVTSVSGVIAAGVTVSVTNPTTIPAITVALGAITPTSVVASGSVTGSNLSGTNTGDQTDATLPFTDILTNNVSITKHGYVPKAPNDANQVLRGDATWGVPTAGISGNTQSFTASGTWTKPANGTMAFIQVWGGGGSGSFDSTSGTYAGGGGGSYKERWVPVSSLASSETVTIGAGGVGKTVNGNGNNGGSSNFGAWVTAYGGAGGQASNTGGAGGGWASNSTTSTNDTPGEGIGVSQNVGKTGYFVGGGGGGGDTVTPAAKAGGVSVYGGGGGGGRGGAGGASMYGGNGGAGAIAGAGTAGTVPGGGGGSGQASTSGAGGGGKIVVTLF